MKILINLDVPLRTLVNGLLLMPSSARNMNYTYFISFTVSIYYAKNIN